MAQRPTVLMVLGTRPEIVKLAPVARSLRAAGAKPIICLTGQHLDLAPPFLRLFPFSVEYTLAAMRKGQSLSELSARLFKSIGAVLAMERPQAVVVQGDTSSAFVGALSAFYDHIPVAHVEAGLRSGDVYEPFPEEVNRQIITSVATYHYAPTGLARDNLLAAGVSRGAIVVTGNTGIDTLLAFARGSGALGAVGAQGRFILVTAHRRENIGTPLQGICRAVIRIVREHRDISVIWILHPNPAVQRQVHQALDNIDRVVLRPPQPYETFARLLSLSWLVLSDSGGIQEEVTALGKPILILRERTERPEVLRAGNGVLVGGREDDIVKAVEILIRRPSEYSRRAKKSRVFGDGHASDAIARHLVQQLRIREPRRSRRIIADI